MGKKARWRNDQLPSGNFAIGEMMIPWEIKAREFVNCNCDYGCPCQFNALPTDGTCKAIAGFLIEHGHFGDTNLDGLNMISIMKWPGPIHEGGGEHFFIITEQADEDQRNGLLKIMSGEETEPGATMFNVFASTMDRGHDPVFTTIEMDIDVEARSGRIYVAGIVDTRGEPIRNPVTGAEHRAQIGLENGFEYTIAEMGSGTSTISGPISLEFKDSYGQFAQIHLSNQGIVR